MGNRSGEGARLPYFQIYIHELSPLYFHCLEAKHPIIFQGFIYRVAQSRVNIITISVSYEILFKRF